MPRYNARLQDAWDLELDEELTDEELLLDETGDELPPPSRRARKSEPTGGRQRRTSAISDEEDADVADEAEDAGPRYRDRKRVEVSEGFKCRHCRNFIGIPPSGGRNRNHCPLCLYSLHVDGKTPGDRASECRSLMRPIGVFYRPKGEQMVIHRCLGCGFVRYNRIAADDNPLALGDLPVLDPPETNPDWATAPRES